MRVWCRCNGVRRVRYAPDVPEVAVQDPISPGGILQTLFLKWTPLGKNRPQEPVTSREIRGWLKHMLGACPNQTSLQVYLKEASQFGWRLLALLCRFGIKVEILPHQAYQKRRGVRSAGLYTPQHRTVSLDEDFLGRPYDSPVHHELGHALDHLISTLCLRAKNCSELLWHGFAPQREAFVTPYAGKEPREYLAESVEAYHQPHSRIWLRENDPGMHAFLQALFELSHT